MPTDAPTAFFSYSRDDLEFALRLAKDLKKVGASVWMDKLDIRAGQLWERKVEDALGICPRVLVILSPSSVNSPQVMAEVAFALDEEKEVIPVICRDCKIPYRLRPIQHLDFRADYSEAFQELLDSMGVERQASVAAVSPEGQAVIATIDRGSEAAEQASLAQEERARQEQGRKEAVEKARLELQEIERQVAAGQARLAEERRAREEHEREVAAEKTRLEQEERARQAAARQARLAEEKRAREDEERKAAAEKARRQQEERDRQAAAEQARLAEEKRAADEQERKAATEKARLHQQEKKRQTAVDVPREKRAPGALASVVFGVLGITFFAFGLFFGIAAIKQSAKAREFIQLDPTYTGMGMARTGQVFGWIGCVGSPIFLIAIIFSSSR